MFHPVGNEPSSVYWRRRLLLFASLALLIVLIALTVRAMGSSAAGKPLGDPSHHRAPSPPATGRPAASGTAASSSSSASRSATHSRHQHATDSRHSTSVSNTAPSSASPDASTSAPPPRCQAKDLDIRAVVARTSYKVGQRPEVELQVTNTGAQPCVQDLADQQIVLKVYNGESRVWGSHDCQVAPGTDDRVLAVDSPVRVSILWSGLTSQPNCAGTRQRVGAGTYTLYASLSGHTGKAAQFSIS